MRGRSPPPSPPLPGLGVSAPLCSWAGRGGRARRGLEGLSPLGAGRLGASARPQPVIASGAAPVCEQSAAAAEPPAPPAAPRSSTAGRNRYQGLPRGGRAQGGRSVGQSGRGVAAAHAWSPHTAPRTRLPPHGRGAPAGPRGSSRAGGPAATPPPVCCFSHGFSQSPMKI